MPKKSRHDATAMGRSLQRIYIKDTARKNMWIDVLYYYAATGDLPGLCYSDATADEARRWIVGEESPLRQYESTVETA